MPAIPSIASFTGASVTEGEFKTALSNLHLFLTGLLGTDGTQAGGQAALGALLGAGESTKTAAYTVTSADRGKVIACSGTFTVTLPDASAVGSGFAVAVANYGTGTITVDPFSTQTIDGATTKTLDANSMLVACAVAGEWMTVGGMTLPLASLTTTGIVRLSASAGSDNDTTAATSSAVKAVYDYAAGKAPASHTHSQYLDTDIGHNIVGSLCLVRWPKSGSAVSPGATISGASIRATDGAAASGGGALSGTWRLLGYVPAGNAGEFSAVLAQRIS